MELRDKNGMTVISDEDVRHIKALHTLFKRHRDTVVVTFKLSKEGRPITNLMSKLWRISDEIIDELRQIGEANDEPKVEQTAAKIP